MDMNIEVNTLTCAGPRTSPSRGLLGPDVEADLLLERADVEHVINIPAGR
jgi:hypothetical protein